MKKVGIGIIGLGNIAGWHIPAYIKNEKAELVAVCDINTKIAKEAAKFFGAKKWYTDYKDLLKDEQIDAVDILLPHHLHSKVVIDAAEAGKNVAVQKPMALNVKDADRMIEATRKADVKFMVDECEVFYPPYVKAKELIENGEIGEPSFIRIGYKHGRLTHPYNINQIKWRSRSGPADWRRDPRKFGGGHFFTAGHHKFAVARHLLGEVAEVRAWIDDIYKPNYYPLVAVWKYVKRWRYGSFDYTFSRGMYVKAQMGPMACVLDITGSDGMIWIMQCEAEMLRVAPLILYKGSGNSLYFDDLTADYSEAFNGMINDFVSSIVEDRKPLVNGEVGKKLLQFSLAIYKSAENNGESVKPASIENWMWPWERDPAILDRIDMSYSRLKPTKRHQTPLDKKPFCH